MLVSVTSVVMSSCVYDSGAETAGEQEEPTILDEPPLGMTGLEIAMNC